MHGRAWDIAAFRFLITGTQAFVAGALCATYCGRAAIKYRVGYDAPHLQAVQTLSPSRSALIHKWSKMAPAAPIRDLECQKGNALPTGSLDRSNDQADKGIVSLSCIARWERWPHVGEIAESASHVLAQPSPYHMPARREYVDGTFVVF